MDRRLLLLSLAILVIAVALLVGGPTLIPAPPPVPAHGDPAGVRPGAEPDHDAEGTSAEGPVDADPMVDRPGPISPNPATGSNYARFTTDHIILPEPWPDLRQEREYELRIWASEDVGSTIDQLRPYADAGDLPALYAIHTGLTSCAALRIAAEGQSFDEIEAAYLRGEFQFEMPEGYDLERVYACYGVLQSDYQGRIDAVTTRLREAGHPAIRAADSLSQYYSSAGPDPAMLADARDGLRSGHPAPLALVGNRVITHRVMNAYIGTSVSPEQVIRAYEGAMTGPEMQAWHLLSCIQSERGGVTYEDCMGSLRADIPIDEIAAYAEEIAAAIMAEDWEALGLGDPQPQP